MYGKELLGKDLLTLKRMESLLDFTAVINAHFGHFTCKTYCVLSLSI